MYLKKIELNNFRKFRTINNVVEFVDAESYQKHKDGENINIAPITTLIVGKNNSGKTTIATALEKLIKENKFEANDFNFSYLKDKLLEYQKKVNNPEAQVKPPFLEFKLTIGIEDTSEDLVTNLVPFMTLGDVDNSELDILIKYVNGEEQIFQKSVFELLNKGIVDFRLRFNKFIELINDSTDFRIKYYNKSYVNVQFKIKDLIELTFIKANNIDNERCLSKAFAKIVEYRYSSLLNNNDKRVLDSKIEDVNHELSKNIAEQHSESINDSLGAIESSEKLEMLLSSNLTFKKLMNGVIKYEYIEQGHNIPETQFGLGYTNLMMIIADLIEYMEKYPDQSFNSKVNLISIEEPETFMHPQMQELFIKHINEAISSLLKSKKKNVNSQLILTTHSSHILNSKIHSGNTFNNINYITTIENSSHVVTLNDDKVTPDGEGIEQENNLKFLKKHIKYKVSELFFSDAVIFVEGITEETLLRYYLEEDSKLNKHYISIFNINGAHGLVYHKLIKLLRVPTLIITDLDIKRNETEKTGFNQITTLDGRITTNPTIKKYYKNDGSLKDIPDYMSDENLRISYQGKTNEYYATSFEEAFILTNYDNAILKKTIKELKPNIFNGIIGATENHENIKENSYKLQRKLAGSKSNFANKLLFELIIAGKDEEDPSLPDYIEKSLEWLSEKLNTTVR